VGRFEASRRGGGAEPLLELRHEFVLGRAGLELAPERHRSDLQRRAGIPFQSQVRPWQLPPRSGPQPQRVRSASRRVQLRRLSQPDERKPERQRARRQLARHPQPQAGRPGPWVQQAARLAEPDHRELVHRAQQAQQPAEPWAASPSPPLAPPRPPDERVGETRLRAELVEEQFVELIAVAEQFCVARGGPPAAALRPPPERLEPPDEPLLAAPSGAPANGSALPLALLSVCWRV